MFGLHDAIWIHNKTRIAEIPYGTPKELIKELDSECKE
jgi:hypothetical protein